MAKLGFGLRFEKKTERTGLELRRKKNRARTPDP